MSELISFTQEQLDSLKQEWIEKELNPIQSERDELLQFKPKEVSEAEKALQEKQQELWNKEVNIELKSAGLEKFADFFVAENTDQLKEKIEKFNILMDEFKVANGYVPSDHKQTTQYDQAKQTGNTKGMIKSLFGI
ncbi:hypothetical protein [Bacillus sp. SJS]|uniref:hypothetical protein n=1 Tax=Bacillus sp. SJS TaxID=1423321 RepID=UPI00068995B5|nr:hypothetical protein [Bacillus sp. SJS]KZZ85646.1 hypothetical protein AS29_003395 [Bacillus sp. SJS]